MKKLVIFSLILLMVAAASFAQVADGISVGGWGRAAFAPWMTRTGYKLATPAGDVDVDAEHFVGSGVTWASVTITEFTVSGVSDYVGFDLNVTFPDGLGGDMPGANVWVKPFSSDLLKVQVGLGKEDRLRGKIGSINGGFEYFGLPGSIYGNEEDAIFKRFQTGMGAIITSAPVEGLFIGVALDPAYYNTTNNRTEGGIWNPWDGVMVGNAEYVYKHAQVGFGYDIADVGLARLQFVGGTINRDNALAAIIAGTGSPLDLVDDTPRLEAAFALTSVEDLTLDIGLKFWFPAKGENSGYEVTATNGINASVGAAFSSGDFGINARIDTGFAGNGKYKASVGGTNMEGKQTLPFTLGARLAPSYNLGFATIGADLGLKISGATKSEATIGSTSVTTENKDETIDFGFGVFIKKGFSNGHIMAGLSLNLPRALNKDMPETKYRPAVFSVPVVLEYYF
jgi:hypothetical protein